MYAGDILLIPLYSIPNILEIIEAVGSATSEAIPPHHQTHITDLGLAVIIWETEGMKYLGVMIRTPISNMFDLNAQSLLYSIKGSQSLGYSAIVVTGQNWSSEDDWLYYFPLYSKILAW